MTKIGEKATDEVANADALANGTAQIVPPMSDTTKVASHVVGPFPKADLAKSEDNKC